MEKIIKISKLVENIQNVFIVSRKRNKQVKSEMGEHELTGAKIVMVFPSRRSAEKYVNYWTDGKNIFDILERKLG